MECKACKKIESIDKAIAGLEVLYSMTDKTDIIEAVHCLGKGIMEQEKLHLEEFHCTCKGEDQCQK